MSLNVVAVPPAACSGDMNSGVPMRPPSTVRRALFSWSASPKSASFTLPDLSIMMLLGFTSLCTMPRSCVYVRAFARVATILTALSSETGRRLCIVFSRESPSTNSIV